MAKRSDRQGAAVALGGGKAQVEVGAVALGGGKAQVEVGAVALGGGKAQVEIGAVALGGGKAQEVEVVAVAPGGAGRRLRSWQWRLAAQGARWRRGAVGKAHIEGGTL
jgi:hypothetical protein